MKILQLGKFYPIRGGVEKVMWDVTRGLCADGVDCDMLCAFDKASIKDGDVLPEKGEIVFNDHGRCICVPALGKFAATMLSPAMILYLRRHCKDYDIIHVHHPDPMAALALRHSGYRGRVILHWHSDILKQKLFLKFYKPLQNWLTRRADLILGTTPVYVQQSPYLQKVQDKISYVPIGIEPIRYDASMAEELRKSVDGRKIVFSLGRLVSYKGYGFLVDSAKYLPEDYIVVIGGMGPLEAELKRQISESGLEGRVLLTGYLTDEEAHAWMGACSLFVLSSVMKTEAFGIVQIEAMSCGKPVIATCIPGSGTSWVNEDGVSGLNVRIEDSKALAEAVLKICEDAGTYSDFCQKARLRYEKLFTNGSMIELLKNKYDIC